VTLFLGAINQTLISHGKKVRRDNMQIFAMSFYNSILIMLLRTNDRLCGQVVRVSG
jgi:hypothetical protein